MTTIEYDLDTSGGLMEQIHKLVAPPQSEENARKNRRADREHRRHGRAVNHDSCDSCKEGGDLLCCDRCPAAFHLQCHDPPLEEEDLPSGEWICHRCRVNPQAEQDDETASNASSQTSRHSSYTRQRNKPQPIPVSRKSSIDELEAMSVDSEEPEHPLQVLVKAAKMMNPKQFELSKDMTCTTMLPGSSKRKWYKDNNKNAPKKLAHELDNGLVPLPAKVCFLCSKSCRVAPLIQCDYCPLLFHPDCLNPPMTTLPSGRWMCPNHAENFVDEKMLKSVSLTERVKLWDRFSGHTNQNAIKTNFLKKMHRRNPPFRIKIKHPARKAIKVPQAIKDQYTFPPPLLPKVHEVPQMMPDWPPKTTASPTPDISLEQQEDWLASVVSLQTSIAKYLAQKQLKEGASSTVSSATEKSTTEPSKPTASVTPTVKHERTTTPSPTPSNSSLCSNESTGMKLERTLLNGAVGSPTQENFLNGPFHDTPKQNGPVSLLNNNNNNTSCPITPNGETDLKSDLTKGITETCVRGKDGSPSIVKVTVPCTEKQNVQPKSIVLGTVTRQSNNSTVVTKVIGTTSSLQQPVRTINTPGAVKTITGSNATSILSPRAAASSRSNVPGKIAVVSGSGNGAGSKVITVTAPGMGKSSPSVSAMQNKMNAAGTLSSSPAIINLNNSLQACIDGNAEVELSKLDERLVQILAWQRLQQLLPPKPVGKKGMLNGLLSHTGSTDVQARALLCPLVGKGQPIAMPYRCLTIGTGGDMDVCLSNFGHCNFVSAKHATIFYDETTRHFELLNYSEHGSTVDNVLYSCDFSEKPFTTPQPTSVVKEVRKIIGKGKKKKQESQSIPPPVPVADKPTMSGHAGEVQKHCSCKASSSSLIGGSGAGWEGTALLHHGSYIKFGCVQFAFSIVEQAIHDASIEQRQGEGNSILKPQIVKSNSVP